MQSPAPMEGPAFDRGMPARAAGDQRPRSVEQGLGRLSEAVARLRDLARHLEDRLGPACRPAPPQPTNGHGGPPQAIDCPLAGSLAEMARQVEDGNEALRGLLERLEL